MSRKIIAVLGISGVGKTTMVKSFVEQHPSVLSVSASELLKHQLSETDSEKLRTAASSEIHSNQDQLTIAFEGFKRATPNQHIIFDGHSVIDNDDGVVVIPTETFKGIAPDLIIFIEESPDGIVSRREADTSRPRPFRSVHNLDAQQTLARETAMSYGRELMVPFKLIQSRENYEFENLLVAALGMDGR